MLRISFTGALLSAAVALPAAAQDAYVIGVSAEISSVMMFLGALSMVAGGLLAMGQRDFKRLLAYSSISQIGYIVLGLGLATPLGIIGGLFHLFNHSLFKSLLFLNSGAVEYSAGTRNLEEMGGLSKRMPLTSATTLIGSMSIAGVPPFNGFWSKLIIIMAAVEAGRYGYAFWAVAVSVLTLAMYMKVMKSAFFGNLKERLSQIKEAPAGMKLAMAALAFVCLIGGLLLVPEINRIFLDSASKALLGGAGYAAAILGAVQ